MFVPLFRLGNPSISESIAAAQVVCLMGQDRRKPSQISMRCSPVDRLRMVGCTFLFILYPQPYTRPYFWSCLEQETFKMTFVTVIDF